MRNLSAPLVHAIFLAALFFCSDVASAQDHPRVLCADCREPGVHPSDFGNAAFNAARAPDNGFTFSDLDVVEVINSTGQWAWVNLAFEMMTIDVGFDVPTFIVPTGNIVIEVTDANANFTTYSVDLDIPNQLDVGIGFGPGYNEAGAGDASGSGDGSPADGSGGDGGFGNYGGVSYQWPGWHSGNSTQVFSCFADFSKPHTLTVTCSRS